MYATYHEAANAAIATSLATGFYFRPAPCGRYFTVEFAA